MDFLKAEIERKKRQIQEKNVLQPEKKYFKRGDLMKVQEKEYLSKYGPENAKEKEQVPEEADEAEEVEEEEEDLTSPNLYPLPGQEVTRRLRELMEPSRVFGETDELANRRLRNIVLDADGDSFRLHKSSNDFQEAMRAVDKQYLKVVEAADPEADTKERLELKIYSTNLSYGELQTLALEIRKGNAKHDHMVISEWIKLIMTLWGGELNKRQEREKMSTQGKKESAIFTQTKMYIKPLLKLLKKNQLSDDIRDSLSHMAKYILHKDYILANEKYMEMAIGNAPWPIGVTNAGIHARPGRERIFAKHVAHVLNDESQRRWIQGLKRLVTKTQQYFPTDPSRMVEYIKADLRPQAGDGDRGEAEDGTEG